jgi:hypothetical protein
MSDLEDATRLLEEADRVLDEARREGQRTVNIQQAMAYAGVSRRTVHYWIAKGQVRVELVNGRKRILLASLRRRPLDTAQALRT